jgi:hypothetical protein
VKATKTGVARRIPVEAELLPLLRRMHARHTSRGGKTSDPCLWLPDADERAVLLRQHLERAGVNRPGLFRNDARHRHVTFHDLRATGITWMAVRGDDPLKIKQRAGHSSFSTTEIYIREAEAVREGFGEPFPTLPGCLLESPRNRPGRFGGSRSSQKQDVWSGADENRTLLSVFPSTPCETRTCPAFARKHGGMSIPFGSTGFPPVPSHSASSRHNDGTWEGPAWDAAPRPRRVQPHQRSGR